MTTVPNTPAELNDGEAGYPRSWRWDTDGLVADGTYVRMDRAASEYGEKPILVLNIDGEDRSIWVSDTALRSQLADELRRRGTRRFDVGERIIARRGAEKKQSGNDRGYWPYRTRFPDAPASDDADILGIDVAAAPESDDGDDIPF